MPNIGEYGKGSNIPDESYISSQQRKKELLDQAVSGPIRKKGDTTMDAPNTTVRAKGGGGLLRKQGRISWIPICPSEGIILCL